MKTALSIENIHLTDSAFTIADYKCSDPDAFGSLTRSGVVEIINTKCSEFRASFTRVNLRRLWMQRGLATAPLLARVSPFPDRVALNFLLPGSSPTVRQGTVLSERDISFYGMHKASSLQWTGRTSYASASLNINDYMQAGRSLLGPDFTVNPEFEVLQPEQQAMHKLQNIHAHIMYLAVNKPETFATHAIVRAFELQFLEALFSALSGSLPRPTDTCANHRQVIAKFLDLIEASSEIPLYLTDICENIGISARTLRFIVRKHLGIKPQQYLNDRRLHLARKSLILATKGATTVTNVATQLGFWELGRFAVNYRLMFGESPAATLRADPRAYSNPHYQLSF